MAGLRRGGGKGDELPVMSPDVEFEDPLAAALWEARRHGTTIAPLDRGELTLDRAERVAAELYQTVEAEGGRQVAWKIGAGDAAAQARFGTDRPFTAPVLDASCLRDGATLRLASLVAPRLEAEIGLRFDGGSAAVLPCIEIIDCRFPGWQIKIAEVLADFGLQGAMLFGEPRPSGPQVRAVVRRDGEVVAEGAGTVSSAVAATRDALGEPRRAHHHLPRHQCHRRLGPRRPAPRSGGGLRRRARPWRRRGGGRPVVSHHGGGGRRGGPGGRVAAGGRGDQGRRAGGRAGSRAGGDPRLEHLVAVAGNPRGRPQRPEPADRHALPEPTAGVPSARTGRGPHHR